MNTNIESIAFDYSESDKAKFQNGQDIYWKNIEESYQKILLKCNDSLKISNSGTHKEWVSQRVKLHMTTSLMRLLYLTESFRDSAVKFNIVSAAVHNKAMCEIPLHLGYLVWVLSSRTKFDDMRLELSNIAFGLRDPDTGLTGHAKISQKTFYKRADEMLEKHFKDNPSTIKIFETIYKEANATGHHNFEGRSMLTGLQNGDTWVSKDRKEWFIFLSSNIFQVFLHCSTVLLMSLVFVNAIDHYLNQLQENFD